MSETQAEMMEREGWWPIWRAADRARVSVHTVYRWIRADEVESTKVGGRWYVAVRSIAEKLGPVAAKAAGILNQRDEEFEITLDDV